MVRILRIAEKGLIGMSWWRKRKTTLSSSQATSRDQFFTVCTFVLPFCSGINKPNGATIFMEIAALLAVGLNDWIDVGVILGILLLNASIGFY